jgi:hypothetical protein
MWAIRSGFLLIPIGGPPRRIVPGSGAARVGQEIQSMSHIVTIRTEVRDPLAVAAACRRLGLPEPAQGTAQLFSGEATGLLVKLPGWLYPLVLDTASGQVRFDNYGGSWVR